MNVVPWLLTAIAIGVAAALFVENRETERQRDALDRQLDTLNRQLERGGAAALALEKARAKEDEARRVLDSALQAEAAAKRAASDAERAAREAQRARAASEKVQAEAAQRDAEMVRLVAEKAVNERLQAEKAALEIARERLATEKAQAEARAAAEQARQKSAPYSIPSAEARQAAMDLEAQGRGEEAVRKYIQAARSGNCEAAARLGEIYDKGLAGVTRNYAESLKWYNAARVLGCNVPLSPRS